MYKFSIRSHFVKDVDPLHDTPLSYHYEPDLDPEIIEGRLLMTVFLYTHRTPLHSVTTNIEQLLSYCHIKCGIKHWKKSAGIRILQKGIDWLKASGYISFVDGCAEILTQRRYRDVIEWAVDESLFNMSLGNECFDPFIQMYERDVTTLFESDVPNLEKVLRVYCYIRACLKSKSPFVSMVAARDIIDDTGYSAGYISKVTRLLCDELGILHRVALNRTSEQYPPYMYIANIPNWQQYLNEEAADINDRRGGVPVKYKLGARHDQDASQPVSMPEHQPIQPEPAETVVSEELFKRPFNIDGEPKEVLGQNINGEEDLLAAFKYTWQNGLLLDMQNEQRQSYINEINNNMEKLAVDFGIAPERLNDKLREHIKNVVLAQKKYGVKNE